MALFAIPSLRAATKTSGGDTPRPLNVVGTVFLTSSTMFNILVIVSLGLETGFPVPTPSANRFLERYCTVPTLRTNVFRSCSRGRRTPEPALTLLVAARAAALNSLESRAAQISGKKIVETCSASSASFAKVRISSGRYNVDRRASATRWFNMGRQILFDRSGISDNYLFAMVWRKEK